MSSGKWCMTAAVMAISVALPQPSTAGLYQDDLSRCVIAAANDEDRKVLMRWIFAAMAANPGIKDMANVTPDQAAALSKDTSELMQRLLLTDCRPQTIKALRYEGSGAIQQSFGVLGQVAMRDLMQDANTNAYVAKLSNYLNKEQWRKLGEEAGIKIPVATP